MRMDCFVEVNEMMMGGAEDMYNYNCNGSVALAE